MRNHLPLRSPFPTALLLLLMVLGPCAATEQLIPPDDPGPGDVRFDVHSGAGRRAISPYMYGINGDDAGTLPANLTLWRFGGNRLTAYNWENSASNGGEDWYNQNDDYLGGGNTPGDTTTGGSTPIP